MTRDSFVTGIVRDRDWHVCVHHGSWLLPPIFLPYFLHSSSSSSEPAVNPNLHEKKDFECALRNNDFPPTLEGKCKGKMHASECCANRPATTRLIVGLSECACLESDREHDRAGGPFWLASPER